MVTNQSVRGWLPRSGRMCAWTQRSTGDTQRLTRGRSLRPRGRGATRPAGTTMEVTQPVATPVVEPAVQPAAKTDETPLLPRGQLLAISVYWFGISVMWGGYEIFGQQKVESLVGVPTRGQTMGFLEFGAAIVSRSSSSRRSARSATTCVALGAAQAVHLRRRAARRRVHLSDRDVAVADRRWPRSCCFSRSAPTSPRARSRATCRTSCPTARSIPRAR